MSFSIWRLFDDPRTYVRECCNNSDQRYGNSLEFGPSDYPSENVDHTQNEFEPYSLSEFPGEIFISTIMVCYARPFTEQYDELLAQSLEKDILLLPSGPNTVFLSLHQRRCLHFSAGAAAERVVMILLSSSNS